MKEPLDPPTIRYTVTETSLRLIFEQIIWNGVLKKIYLSTYIQDPRSKSIVYNDLNSFTHRFHQCVEFPDGSTNYPPANQRELPRSNRLPSIVEGRRRDKEGDPRGGVVGFPRLDGLIWKAGRVSRKGGEKWERQREIYIYIYLLFPELRLENVGGVADGPHFLQPSFHSRQPDLHLVPFRLVSLAVPEHRVQLRLPLHHFRVHLVPMLPQLRNWNNNRAVFKRSPLL